MADEAATHFQLGAMTLPYLRWSLDRALEGIARAGFRYVGLRPGHADRALLPEQPAAADYQALRQRIDRHGLTPTLMFAHRHGGDLSESLRRDVDTIAALGIPLLLVIPPSPGPKFAAERLGEMVWFSHVEHWFQEIVPAVRRAERRGVTLVLKPHGGIAGTAEDLALIVERLGSPAVRVCYDPGNVVYYEGVRPETDLPAVADLVRAVCIKDHRGGQAVVDFPTPGDGDIDHVALFRSLHSAGFTGPCLIERIDGLTAPEEVDRELARGRAYLEQVVTDLTVAVLGTGTRAADHLQTISRLHGVCRLVGVCDADRDRAAATAAQYGVPGFADLERLLVDARPHLLYVVIPPDGHRAAVEVAAHHGVHVVSETPIAPTLPLADAMIAAAARHGVKLEVAENVWRWPYERLKLAIVQAGLIGQVTQVHLWYRSGSYHGMSTTRQLFDAAPVRARGFARATPVPLHVDRLGRQVIADPYELGLVEFGGGAVCVYQYPLHHYRGNAWDVIGSEGAIIGNELVLERDGERQVYPFRQTINEATDPPVLERVYVETEPPVVWENPLRHLPGGATADEVARTDILVGMCQAIQADVAPPYGGRAARADQEVLIAVRESAGRDGAWVGLPLPGITAVEQGLHDAYARRYGHDPLGPVAAAIGTFYPRISPAEMALGTPPAP